MQRLKGVILNYSITGNTIAITDYISDNLPNVTFEKVNIYNTIPDKKNYDFGIIACYSDQLQIPERLIKVLTRIDISISKAIIVNTYGFISGRTLTDLYIEVKKKAIKVINGIAVHTPENYPPMIKKGKGAIGQPDKKELQRLNKFIKKVNQSLSVRGTVLNLGFSIAICVKRLIPRTKRYISKNEMGQLFVIKEQCSRCGLCSRNCCENAIKMIDYPEINLIKCTNCWACYNKCPKNAISSTKTGTGYQYKNGREVIVRNISNTLDQGSAT